MLRLGVRAPTHLRGMLVCPGPGMVRDLGGTDTQPRKTPMEESKVQDNK